MNQQKKCVSSRHVLKFVKYENSFHRKGGNHHRILKCHVRFKNDNDGNYSRFYERKKKKITSDWKWFRLNGVRGRRCVMHIFNIRLSHIALDRIFDGIYMPMIRATYICILYIYICRTPIFLRRYTFCRHLGWRVSRED